MRIRRRPRGTRQRSGDRHGYATATMKFALNYSPQAAELVQDGRLQVGLFKCPDIPEYVAQAASLLPTYVHFGLRAGRGPFDQSDLVRVASLIAVSATDHVSAHLAPRASDFEGMPVDTESPAHASLLVCRMLDDIAQLVDWFGAERIVLENVMWDPEPPYEIPAPALRPSLITHVIEETGCGLLLDIAHARVAAHHFGLDTHEYISALPVERLRELHISGTTRMVDGELTDHVPLSVEDWALTEWVLGHVHAGAWPCPDIVAFEYGGIGPGYESRAESAVLLAQATKLREIAKC